MVQVNQRSKKLGMPLDKKIEQSMFCCLKFITFIHTASIYWFIEYLLCARLCARDTATKKRMIWSLAHSVSNLLGVETSKWIVTMKDVNAGDMEYQGKHRKRTLTWTGVGGGEELKELPVR